MSRSELLLVSPRQQQSGRLRFGNFTSLNQSNPKSVAALAADEGGKLRSNHWHLLFRFVSQLVL